MIKAKETQQFIDYLKSQPGDSIPKTLPHYIIAQTMVTAEGLGRNSIPFAVATIIETICAVARAGKDIQEFQSAMDEITELIKPKSSNRN